MYVCVDYAKLAYNGASGCSEEADYNNLVIMLLLSAFSN